MTDLMSPPTARGRNHDRQRATVLALIELDGEPRTLRAWTMPAGAAAALAAVVIAAGALTSGLGPDRNQEPGRIGSRPSAPGNLPDPAPPSRVLPTQLTQTLLDRCVQDGQGWTRPSPYTGFEVQSPTTDRWEYIVVGRFVSGPLTGGYVTCRGVDRGAATESEAFGHEGVKDRPYLRAVVEGKGGGSSLAYEEGATTGTARHSLQGVAAAGVAAVTVDFLDDNTGQRTTVLHDGVWFLPDVSLPAAVHDFRDVSEGPGGTIQIRGHTMYVIRGYDAAGNLIFDSRTSRGSSAARYPWP